MSWLGVLGSIQSWVQILPLPSLPSLSQFPHMKMVDNFTWPIVLLWELGE